VLFIGYFKQIINKIPFWNYKRVLFEPLEILLKYNFKKLIRVLYFSNKKTEKGQIGPFFYNFSENRLKIKDAILLKLL